VNGKMVTAPTLVDGYACLNRQWSGSDQITLEMAMPVERMEANPKVTEDHGRVAITRGPLVYGLEGLDHAGNLDIILAAQSAFTSEYRADLLGGITLIHATSTTGKPLTAIPFYTLANRGLSSQVVWIRQDGATPSPADWNGALYRIVEDRASRHHN
jgi:uncharacterized protein